MTVPSGLTMRGPAQPAPRPHQLLKRLVLGERFASSRISPAAPGSGAGGLFPPPPKPRGVETVGVTCDKQLRWPGIVWALKPGSPYGNHFMAATGLPAAATTTTA